MTSAGWLPDRLRLHPAAVSYPTSRVWCDRRLCKAFRDRAGPLRLVPRRDSSACSCGRPARGVPLLTRRHRRATRAHVAGLDRRVVMPRPPADTDSTSKPGAIVIPGSTCRFKSICGSKARASAIGISAAIRSKLLSRASLSGCNAGFLPPIARLQRHASRAPA